VAQPDSLRSAFERQINSALANVDHSAPSVSKYRELEKLIGGLIDIEPKRVYAAYISKAGNVTVRFDQSPRAREADVLVALTDPPRAEPLSRSIESLRRHCLAKRQGVEALVLTYTQGAWRPYTLLVPSSEGQGGRPLLQPIVDVWHDVQVLGYLPTAGRTLQDDAAEVLRIIGLDPKQLLKRSDRPAFPYLELRRDLWDDYTFKTTFLPTLRLAQGESVELEEVKILIRGQDGGPTPLPDGSFRKLPRNYCSLGQSYSYYETLKQLPQPIYRGLLRALRDVVFDPQIRVDFQEELGFRRSLARNGPAVRALRDAPAMFGRDSEQQRREVEGLSFVFRTNVGGASFDIGSTQSLATTAPGRLNYSLIWR
jgi:hypothetical protein